MLAISFLLRLQTKQIYKFSAAGEDVGTRGVVVDVVPVPGKVVVPITPPPGIVVVPFIGDAGSRCATANQTNKIITMIATIYQIALEFIILYYALIMYAVAGMDLLVVLTFTI